MDLTPTGMQLLFPVATFTDATDTAVANALAGRFPTSQRGTILLPGTPFAPVPSMQDFRDIILRLREPCQTSPKHKRRNKALPEAEPEARDAIVLARRSFGRVRARRASSQNAQQQ